MSANLVKLMFMTTTIHVSANKMLVKWMAHKDDVKYLKIVRVTMVRKAVQSMF